MVKVALEVSTLGNQIKTASGSVAYQIGTRNASTTLRLHDGETQLLAGLISSVDNTSANKIPGLGDLPVAGRLFSSQRDNGSRVELVLSITPHVIRNLRQPDASEAELWIGTESNPRIRPAGGIAAPLERSGAPSALVPDTQLPSIGPPGASVGAASLGAQKPPGTSAVSGPTVRWDGPAQVKVGETFTVSLELQTNQPLRGAPVQLRYPKEQLELVDLQEGDLFKQGGAQTNFTKTVDLAAGQASAGVLRTTATGATGKGNAFVLRFKALAAGSADVALLKLQPVGLSGLVPDPTVLPVHRVQVQ